MFKPLIDWYLGALAKGGYGLIALLMAVESSIVPLPSEVVIPPAAHLAYTGQIPLSLAGIILAGTIGSWLGATVMYWASRLAGRPLVMRYGKYFLISPSKVEGAERYVFPSLLTGEKPMSDNTVNTALRRMGYSNSEMTAHGFRAMARTILGEHLETDPEVIEAQLAHGKSGPLGSAYDRTTYMAQRRQMMKEWADYLDKIRKGADVIALRA